MAVPKRKTSKCRARKRRTHQKTEGINTSTCPECGEAKLHHQACLQCGTYKGRSITEVEE